MYSFLVASSKGANLNMENLGTPGVSDVRPMMHTFSSTEEQASPKDQSHYQWFTYKKSKPVLVNFRGRQIEIGKGTKFGVRKSGDQKKIRLIFPNDPNRVITVPMEQAQQLAKGV